MVSIVMPCLNEAAAVGSCVEEAKAFLAEYGFPGEILVVDNGSSDASARIAREHGAIVVTEPRKGYGRAIRTGIGRSRGAVIAMGDCDTTYRFHDLGQMLPLLAEGTADVVIGDRFAGRMEKGALPRLNQCGAKVLSFFGRVRFRVQIRDFHCGLRAMTREAAERMTLKTDGMEFSTEMIAEAKRKNLHLAEVPVWFGRSRCDRDSKLHPFSDGLRHLVYMWKG